MVKAGHSNLACKLGMLLNLTSAEICFNKWILEDKKSRWVLGKQLSWSRMDFSVFRGSILVKRFDLFARGMSRWLTHSSHTQGKQRQMEKKWMKLWSTKCSFALSFRKSLPMQGCKLVKFCCRHKPSETNICFFHSSYQEAWGFCIRTHRRIEAMLNCI